MVATAKKAKRGAESEAPVAVKEKAEKGTGTCLFSGLPTGSKRSKFLPGYDAKLKSLLLRVMRGEEKMSAIPQPALPFLKSEKGLVGFRIRDGKLEITGNFGLGKGRTKKAAKSEAAAKVTSKKKLLKPKDDEDEEMSFDDEDEDEDEE